ncbi:MAG TPA: hypothetical protein PKD55_16730 [Bellilinea sp.]|nr:hypothetical protein [Bellilinea sp.]
MPKPHTKPIRLYHRVAYRIEETDIVIAAARDERKVAVASAMVLLAGGALFYSSSIENSVVVGDRMYGTWAYPGRAVVAFCVSNNIRL